MLPQSPLGQMGEGSQANGNEFLFIFIPPCSVGGSAGPSLWGQEFFVEEM